MKNNYRSFLSIAFFVAAFSVGITAVSGQIVFKRNAPVVSTQTQPTQQVDNVKQLPPAAFSGTVNVKVVWSKVLGLPPTYPGSGEAHPMPCGLFVISVSNSRERIKSSEGREIAIERANGFERYVCNYTLEGLPKGQELGVSAQFIDSRVWESDSWISVYSANGAAAPPAGQMRVLNGGRRVILTDTEPTANVEFLIAYDRRPIKIF